MTGGDLRFHISRKSFTEEAVRFWMAELGCALRYIHGQGIVHRDLKPDNVLLDSEGHVHLADFVSTHGPKEYYVSNESHHLECGLRFQADEAAHKQVRNSCISSARSVRGQWILVRGRLVVARCHILRVHIQ